MGFRSIGCLSDGAEVGVYNPSFNRSQTLIFINGK